MQDMHISHRKIKTDNVREAELIQTQSVFSGIRLDGKKKNTRNLDCPH